MKSNVIFIIYVFLLGVRYFECDSNYGLFVKRAQCKIDAEEVTDSRSKLATLRAKRDGTKPSNITEQSSGISPNIPSNEEDKLSSNQAKIAALKAKRDSLTPNAEKKLLADLKTVSSEPIQDASNALGLETSRILGDDIRVITFILHVKMTSPPFPCTNSSTAASC